MSLLVCLFACVFVLSFCCSVVRTSAVCVAPTAPDMHDRINRLAHYGLSPVAVVIVAVLTHLCALPVVESMPLSLPLRYHAKIATRTLFEELEQVKVMMASLFVPTTPQLEFGDMVVMSQGEMWQQVRDKFERLVEIGGPEFVKANSDAFQKLQEKIDAMVAAIQIALTKQWLEKVDPRLDALSQAAAAPKQPAFQYLQALEKALIGIKKISIGSHIDFKHLARSNKTPDSPGDDVLAPIEESQTKRKDFLDGVIAHTSKIANSTIDLESEPTQNSVNAMLSFCTKPSDDHPGYDDFPRPKLPILRICGDVPHRTQLFQHNPNRIQQHVV